MASKGNLGIEINLNKVPCREANMTPYEIMLSESQERMLIVLENGKEEKAKKIFDKWNLDFAVIGKTTNSKKIELFFDNEQVADIPVNTLVENSPMYDRKWKKAKLPKKNNSIFLELVVLPITAKSKFHLSNIFLAFSSLPFSRTINILSWLSESMIS